MTKIKNNKDVVDNIKSEISLSKQQFLKYQKYLSDNFYKNTLDYLLNNLDEEKTISITIANLTMKELSRIVNDGNIDLEIELINDYRSKTQFLMRKLNVSNSIIKEIEENVLIEAIENYDGNSTFHVYILKCIKNKIETLKNKTVNIKNQTPINNNIDVEKNDDLEKKEHKNKQNLSFNDKLNKYVIEKDIKKRKPMYLENAFRIIKPFMDEIEESQFNKFVYLRYGYYDDIYFSLDDISNILSIDLEKTTDYYNRSLSLLKKGTENAINKYIKQEFNKIKKLEK